MISQGPLKKKKLGEFCLSMLNLTKHRSKKQGLKTKYLLRSDSDLFYPLVILIFFQRMSFLFRWL